MPLPFIEVYGQGRVVAAERSGSSITIPPRALHTFTVLSPTTKFLVVSLTGAMGVWTFALLGAVIHIML